MWPRVGTPLVWSDLVLFERLFLNQILKQIQLQLYFALVPFLYISHI